MDNDYSILELNELLNLYENESYIPYAQYLRVVNWWSKRHEILNRDHFRCQNCNGYETTKIKGTKERYKWVDTEVLIWTDYNSGEQEYSELIKPLLKPKKSYNLQIHHKKYIKDRLPWQYDNDDLITLCNHCHLELHENNTIPIFDNKGNQIVGFESCDRCAGTGTLEIYMHVQNGVCFKCKGNRFNVKLIENKPSN